MPAPIIAAGIGGASSILGSVFSGKPKTTTQSQTSSSTNTSMPTFTPEGLQLQRQLLDYQSNLLRDPAAGTGAINSAGVNRINTNYDQLPGQISQQLASRGFGKSGELGQSLYSVGNERLNALSNFQSQMNQLILGRQAQGAALGQDLLNANRGSTTTSNSTSTGTSTGPGNMAANGLLSAGNGLSNLSTLLMLQKILKPGGGGYSETSSPTWGLPTAGSPGDWGGEY